jgi:hypothetical protein
MVTDAASYNLERGKEGPFHAVLQSMIPEDVSRSQDSFLRRWS